MIEELRKSINSTLYERVSSPLFGALFLSWLVWNWKIVYLTIFVNEKNINGSKIDYISNNYLDVHFLVTYPLISTLILLTIVPFFTNGAYFLHLKFHKWRVDKKHEVEKNQLLTLEQSIQLRSEIAVKEQDFKNMISGKDNEIESLKFQLQEVKNSSPTTTSSSNMQGKVVFKTNESEKIEEIAGKILSSEELNSYLDIISQHIQSGWKIGDQVPPNVLGYYISNNLIESTGGGIFEFTDFGKQVYKEILESRF
ncbi:MAG TPA: hypothetical protein ENJ28_09795 [Gammaproteobacteria bacterium]|nr:hypothetical protein [Gammaproteobacteria bacterium]